MVENLNLKCFSKLQINYDSNGLTRSYISCMTMSLKKLKTFGITLILNNVRNLETNNQININIICFHFQNPAYY